MVFLLGLLAIVVAKETDPAAIEGATAGFVLAIFASLLFVWRTANRHWRCPSCDVRWETSDTLASFHWNHCTSCGAPLRAYPQQRERERAALTDFALAARSREELRADFERRRRRSLIAAGVATVAGLAALLAIEQTDVPEWVGQGTVALFTAIVAATVVHGARCPRCRTGIVTRGHHCQRCGLQLGDPLSDAADPRTGA